MNDKQDKKKLVIGLYGEMQLSMVLHERGWQVHRAYIDEGIDFVVTKYWCEYCNEYVGQYIKNKEYQGKKRKCVTNLCEKCQKESLKIVSKYLQVKTSEGKGKKEGTKDFSFHPKIRYNIDKDVFYVWIAVFLNEDDIKEAETNTTKIHYYIFSANDVSMFDDISIPTYQITDNQKTTLKINKEGKVLNKGKKYDYSCFCSFHNNFDILEVQQ